MIRKVLGPLFFVVLFNVVAIGVLLLIPPSVGIVWVIALGGAYVWSQLRRSKHWLRRRAQIRIRAPRASLVWVAVACLSTLLILLGLAGLIEATGTPMRPEELRGWEKLSAYQKTIPGWIAFTALIALVIPIVEEFNFRGRMQHALERRYGIAIALGATSLLFMITHIGVPRSAILLIPLTLGLANGLAVVTFGSIWVGIATHMLWNGGMAVLGLLKAEASPAPATANTTVLVMRTVVLLLVGAVGWWLVLRRVKRKPTDVAR
jgi:membrane protease YdiL (CAAX protease family)